MDNLRIVYKSVKQLVPYANNARVHTESQVNIIAKSIQEFGFNNPVLIDDMGNVIAGHGRILAAQKLDLKKVPCIVLSHLSDRQQRAYILADNKIALRSTWDMDKLSTELSDLVGMGFDLGLTGFDEGELDSILRSEIIIPDFPVAPEPPATAPEPTQTIRSEVVTGGLTDDDVVPDNPNIPVSEHGDVWVLGDHKVMCGDSTDPNQVLVLMAGSKANMVFTDPPYNVKVSGLGAGSSENSIGKIHGEFLMGSGEMSEEQFTEFLRKVFDNLKANSNDGAIHYVCMDWRHMKEVLKASETYTTVGGGNCSSS